jgi:hypothetical protein
MAWRVGLERSVRQDLAVRAMREATAQLAIAATAFEGDPMEDAAHKLMLDSAALLIAAERRNVA